MSKVIKGVVTWVSDEKKFDNYSFKLKGRDEWFRSPQRAKGIIEKGYEVKVVVEENDRGDFDVKKKPVLLKKGKLPDKGGKGGRGGNGKRDPETEKRIVMQHSQEMGISAAALIIANGGIKLPKTKPDAIKTVILELIDELTAKAFNDSYNADRVLKKAKDVDEDLDDEEEESEDTDSEDEADESEEDESEESEEIEDDVPWDED